MPSPAPHPQAQYYQCAGNGVARTARPQVHQHLAIKLGLFAAGAFESQALLHFDPMWKAKFLHCH